MRANNRIQNDFKQNMRRTKALWTNKGDIRLAHPGMNAKRCNRREKCKIYKDWTNVC